MNVEGMDGLRASQTAFLPLGADVNTAVFRVETESGAPYFLKLRRGNFNEVAVAVPAFLRAQGIRRVMAPITTTTQALFVRAHGFDWMLYPFMEGRNGYEVAMSQAQWVALGESMRAIHATTLPAELEKSMPRERYGARWRDSVRGYDNQVDRARYSDPVAPRLAQLWMDQRDEIRRIVDRAEQLAQMLKRQPPDQVVCHADLHAGNLLLGGDEFAIVDWDELILAPKERDLMFVGGGLFGNRNVEMEEAWFYAGYGDVVDPVALAYYRYERIVADIAAYADQIFGKQGIVEDREEGLRQLTDQFLPGQVIEIAHRTYRQLSEGQFK